MKDDCIFCKIAAGRLPADVVDDTENVLAFRDIAPAAPTHILLIPKEHVADSVADLDASHATLLGELFELATAIAASENLNDGWRLVANVGAGAGQTVWHVHFHLLGGWSPTRTRPPALAG